MNETAFARARVMVLDDNRNFQSLMRTMLHHLGFRHVDVFSDPRDAMDHVVGTSVDIAFVDLVMPFLDGLRWSHAARRRRSLANPDMAVVLVTAHAVMKVLERGIKVGIDDVLVKPVSPVTLARHSDRLLARRPDYVDGPDGYWGPNVRKRLDSFHRTIDAPIRIPVVTARNPPPRTNTRPATRGVPGFDVDIGPRMRRSALMVD